MPEQETKPSRKGKETSQILAKKQKHFTNTPAAKRKFDKVYNIDRVSLDLWYIIYTTRKNLPDKENAETLDSFFSSVFTIEESESPTVKKSMVQELLSNVTITLSDVGKRLIALRPDKSPGPDKIHPRIILRELAGQVAYILYNIFKESSS